MNFAILRTVGACDFNAIFNTDSGQGSTLLRQVTDGVAADLCEIEDFLKTKSLWRSISIGTFADRRREPKVGGWNNNPSVLVRAASFRT